ncbi:MAG: ankyrin repeat domain-containing protein [Alphaproteobacteria bacterium]|nr:ankyrin repeat domain-containing protein [Alphaproteobacteria bacterium]
MILLFFGLIGVIKKKNLIKAVRKGNKKWVIKFIESGIFYNLFKDDYLKKAFSIAIENGHTEIVELLLKNGAEINETDEIGNTALMYAAENGHKEIVKLLLDNGANIKARNEDGDTAKTLALKNKHYDIVDLIFEYEEKK